jgi:hypothetical protein
VSATIDTDETELGRHMSGPSTPLEESFFTRIGGSPDNRWVTIDHDRQRVRSVALRQGVALTRGGPSEQTPYCSHRTLARLCEISDFVLRFSATIAARLRTDCL